MFAKSMFVVKITRQTDTEIECKIFNINKPKKHSVVTTAMRHIKLYKLLYLGLRIRDFCTNYLFTVFAVEIGGLALQNSHVEVVSFYGVYCRYQCRLSLGYGIR